MGIGEDIGLVSGFFGATIQSGYQFATEQRDAIDRVKSELKVVDQHLGKVSGLDPNDPDRKNKIRDWLNHSRSHIRQARTALEKVKGKTYRELQEAINRSENRIRSIEGANK